MEFITGEAIQEQCQYYLGRQEDFQYNPTIVSQVHKQLDLETTATLATLDFSLLFCYSNRLETDFNKIYSLLETATRPFSLVCHNSDAEFSEKYLCLLDISQLKKIYSQNVSFSPPPKIQPLPIGLANSQWPHGDLSIIRSVRDDLDTDSKIEGSIYFWFEIRTNPTKREQCFEDVSQIIPPLKKRLPFKAYLKLLSQHQFCICPEGNGLDTHRFWEAVYLKVIPICLETPLTLYFSKYVPTVLLKKWSDLNPKKLNYKELYTKGTTATLNPLVLDDFSVYYLEK